MSSHSTIAFVFARGGSKGLPGKNVRILGDRPLIAHTIDIALKTREVSRIVVSTDDEAIAEAARNAGAEVPFTRPPELASDTAPEWKAWQHAIQWVTENWGAFSTFVSLPPTSPFRSTSDIRDCIQRLHATPEVDIVLTGTPAARSPYFNMVKLTNGLASLAAEGERINHRQAAPQLFDLTTVAYAAKPEFVLQNSHIFDGRVGMTEVPAERALDIDTQWDFEIAEFLWQKNNG